MCQKPIEPTNNRAKRKCFEECGEGEARMKKKCNLRRAKCCHTCYHFESYSEDFGSNYSQYCTCPENEDKNDRT